MSSQSEPAWSSFEKDSLLVTLLRAMVPDLTPVLVRMIEDRPFNPALWSDIPLPKGRSVRSCQYAFADLQRMAQQTMPQPPHAYQFHSMHHSIASPVPSMPRKRSWEQDTQISRIREIRPRVPGSTESPVLPVTNGESIQISRLTPSDTRGEPVRKRGRPNKEDRERRDKEYAAKGEVYKPKPRKPKKSEFLSGSPLPPSVADLESTGLSPGPEGSGPETPPRSSQDPKPESSRGSSKKKRPRESLDDMDVASARLSTNIHGEERDTLPAGAESPSDRLLARSKEREHSQSARQISIHATSMTH